MRNPWKTWIQGLFEELIPTAEDARNHSENCPSHDARSWFYFPWKSEHGRRPHIHLEIDRIHHHTSHFQYRYIYLPLAACPHVRSSECPSEIDLGTGVLGSSFGLGACLHVFNLLRFALHCLSLHEGAEPEAGTRGPCNSGADLERLPLPNMTDFFQQPVVSSSCQGVSVGFSGWGGGPRLVSWCHEVYFLGCLGRVPG